MFSVVMSYCVPCVAINRLGEGGILGKSPYLSIELSLASSMLLLSNVIVKCLGKPASV